MRLLAALAITLSISCTGKTDPGATSDDSGATDGTDGASDGSDGATGTDEDGDGFTVEDGDCDDNDIGVNPGREEDVFDGIDNDCDGRIDEEWLGTSVTEQVAGGNSRIVIFDTIARVDDTITLPEGMVPYDIDHGLNGGYVTVVNDSFINISAGTPAFEYTAASVVEVALDGTVTPLATFTDAAWEAEDWENAKFYWFGPIVRGVSAHPDGYYVAATPGTLWRIDPSGATTELASWEWDINDDEAFQLYALDLSVDLLTGDVAIMDLVGGFATWSTTDGLTIHKQADLSEGWANWDAKVGVGVCRMGSDGWWSVVADFTEGSYAVNRFNFGDGDWVERVTWENSLVRPLGIDTDADHDELYVTAKGGDYRSLWRIRNLDGSVDDAFAEVEDGVTMWGITSNY